MKDYPNPYLMDLFDELVLDTIVRLYNDVHAGVGDAARHFQKQITLYIENGLDDEQRQWVKEAVK